MFFVKATYRSETRKFSFQDSDSFPTYEQLYEQLYRVFPISHSYYLSRLLFSSSPANPSARVLIGMEAHNAEEYEVHVRPYRGKDWPSGLLRLSVFDETPHKVPAASTAPAEASDSSTSRKPTKAAIRAAALSDVRRPAKLYSQQVRFGPPPPPPRPVHVSRVPPPPPPPPPPRPPRPSRQPHVHMYPPPPPPPPPMLTLDTNVHNLRPVSSAPSLNPAHPLPPPPPPVSFTSTMRCPATKPLTTESARLATRRSYRDLLRASTGAMLEGDLDRLRKVDKRRSYLDFLVSDELAHYTPPPRLWDLGDELSSFSSPSNDKGEKGKAKAACCDASLAKVEVREMIRKFKVDLDRVLVTTFGPESSSAAMALFSETDTVPRQGPTLADLLNPVVATDSVPAEAAKCEDIKVDEESGKDNVTAEKVVHENIICDSCEKTIEGVRHKCLDCPDYDLCSTCLQKPPSVHPGTHAFFAIEEPGGTWIHTVFAGEGSRAAGTNAAPPRCVRGVAGSTPATGSGPVVDQAVVDEVVPAATTSSPVVHNATCNLCDSRIEGDRYKCVDCPDFDTCSSCAAIIPAQHPAHTFVRVATPSLFVYPAPSPVTPYHSKYANALTHHASCNACARTIRGVRYKCMHPACPDFDLCSDCEALPLAVHSIDHPMLKMRTVGGYVPKVWRHDQGKEDDFLKELSMSTQGQSTAAEVKETIREDEPTVSAPLQDVVMSNEVKDAEIEATETSAESDVMMIPRSTTPSVSNGGNIRMMQSVSYGTPIPVSIPPAPAPLLPMNVDLTAPYFPFFPGYTTPPAVPVLMDAPMAAPSSPVRPTPAAPTPEIHTTLPTPSIFSLLDDAKAKSPEPLSVEADRAPDTVPLLHSAAALPSPPPRLQLDFPPFTSPNSESFEEDVQMPGQYLLEDLRTATQQSSNTLGPNQFDLIYQQYLKRRVPFTPTRTPSPEPLIRFDDRDHDTQDTSTLRDDASQSDEGTASLPRVLPTDFNELFDLATQFRHLLELPPTPPKQLTETESESVSVVAPTDLASTIDEKDTVPSKTPSVQKAPSVRTQTSVQSMIDEVLKAVPRALDEMFGPVSTVPTPEPADAPLRATFLADNNIPDGQIFPPGAEFVKSWRMRNDGESSWPEGTELVFVAGDRLVLDKTERFKVGAVKPGEEVDVWTGEMKAPDVPGKYISYWRLSDSVRGRFGHSIWIEINVAEPSHAPSSDDNEGSLASSSVIMPHSAPAQSSISSVPIAAQDEATTAPLSPALSGTSSVSLIDMPSDDSDSESDIFVDSRSHVGPGSTPAGAHTMSPDVEYVVLYDSSDEE
ncbi:hypothetical protein BV25DRAFT_1849133 [Artomyces pyxidatus]|uniref:Uncharacterized protein n=1 Tax=Artomyces pyxidatus TaxID=48021 RepID=A0ACB8TDR0_9AGAM|nr:hypothetical protein BV25DRAFT_1849133 [Artomyces pyxidatus]